MRLIFKAFSVYCLGLYCELCSKLFDGRINRRLKSNEPLTDKITVYLSNMCWHYSVKAKMAAAEFETQRLALSACSPND